ncbi:MAG: hypothetical protein AAFR35_07825 [Pseudomonadota bacterium]
MIAALLVLMAGTLGVAILALGKSRLGVVTLPFQAAVIYAIWLLPQLFAALPAGLPPAGLGLLVGLAGGALGMTALGWNLARVSAAPPETLRMGALDRFGALLGTAVALVLLAACVQIAISNQPAANLASRQPSGLVTILRTLAALNPVALFLAATLCLLRFNVLTAAVLALALGCYGQELVVQFKRTSVFEVVTALCLALWAARGWAPPRRALLAVLPAAFLFVNVVHEVRRNSGYRVSADGSATLVFPSWEDLARIDWIAVGRNRAGRDIYEVTNGALSLQGLFDGAQFGWGGHLWNALVFRWVPGQFVGADTKAAMAFDLPRMSALVTQYGAEWKLGTTATGFAQPFADFAFLGICVFALNAWIVGRHLRRGLEGSLADLSVVAPLLSAGVVSLTHEGYALLMILPLVLPLRWVLTRALAAPEMPLRGVTA